MASAALVALLVGIQEINDLQAANPIPRGSMPAQPNVVRALNRASVVLLSSHLEAYIRNINEEMVIRVNQTISLSHELPELFRLHHSRVAIDAMSKTQWDNRTRQLEEFTTRDSWLWGGFLKGKLAHERILRWMRSPVSKNIQRFFAIWGIPDVFSRITRTPHTRQRMWLGLNELVEKRNNIAHGDVTTEATKQDVFRYLSVVKTFCQRADRVLSRILSRHIGGSLPW